MRGLSPLPTPAAQSWALFLDVDGTLLDLAEHPDAVVVPEGLPKLLEKLTAALDGALALVSGRSLASLDCLLGDTTFDAAGCHGAEMRIAGQLSILSDASQDVALAAERLVRLASSSPLLMVELKPHSVAFHYRGSEFDALKARQMAVEAIRGLEGRLRLLDGKQVVEVLPQAIGKGAAIARFLASSAYRDRVPVFVGDDVTDEEGFKEVNQRGGISIHVGCRNDTCAQFKAKNVSDIAAWLSGPVCQALQCHERDRAP
ncbi:MAG: trehalose-phosphatase [Rhodospirillales bacterium]|nr:trehalose-phosphatase [Rhodospirillales bacterium]